jgi:hypothetical protein
MSASAGGIQKSDSTRTAAICSSVSFKRLTKVMTTFISLVQTFQATFHRLREQITDAVFGFASRARRYGHRWWSNGRYGATIVSLRVSG